MNPTRHQLNVPCTEAAQAQFETPVTEDGSVVPRIEVREENSSVVFVGVPSALNARYFAVPPDLAELVDGRPTGRACFDCAPGLYTHHQHQSIHHLDENQHRHQDIPVLRDFRLDLKQLLLHH